MIAARLQERAFGRSRSLSITCLPSQASPPIIF
jgi:hypothetical protein